jgi:hypothetical protein
MDRARVYAGSETEVGVLWDGCCDAASKPGPSPAARVRHSENLKGYVVEVWEGAPAAQIMHEESSVPCLPILNCVSGTKVPD